MSVVFVYRCPNTNLNVQGRIESDPTDQEADSYEVVTCTACTGVHLVNPKTGKVFGEEEILLRTGAS
jgi:hypothetical protein